MSITFTLVEGKDYTFEADGRAPALTATGLERMLEAHAAGRDVAIEIDQIVVFRLPAWWGDGQAIRAWMTSIALSPTPYNRFVAWRNGACLSASPACRFNQHHSRRGAHSSRQRSSSNPSLVFDHCRTGFVRQPKSVRNRMHAERSASAE